MITDRQALDILRAQGHTAGAPDLRTGRVRVWIRGSQEVIDVHLGRELRELAEEKLNFDDIWARREEEATAGDEL